MPTEGLCDQRTVEGFVGSLMGQMARDDFEEIGNICV
jgi:hypothetical protein